MAASTFVTRWPRSPFSLALLLLLLLLYGPLLAHWYHGWLFHSINLEHEYFSHGVIGLPFAFYLAWEQRDSWQRLPDRAHPLGFGLLGLAAVAYLSPNSDLIHLSFPLLLLGLMLSLKGGSGLRLLRFPWLLVLLATPTDLPYLLAPYTQPLQVAIAAVAGFLLSLLQVDVVVREMYLFVGGRVVEVAPHCAGLKALLTNFYFCLMGVYVTGAVRDRRKTLWLLVGAIAISVLANILRNTALSLFHGTGADAAFHWLHESWGGEVYWALMVLALVGWFQVVLGWEGWPGVGTGGRSGAGGVSGDNRQEAPALPADWDPFEQVGLHQGDRIDRAKRDEGD